MLGINEYNVYELIHQGKSFLIYRGVRTHDKQKVILKVPRNKQSTFQDLSSLQHEYQILSQLNLPSVIHAFDLIWHENQMILVLEDGEGYCSLRQYLAEQPIDLDIFFKISDQLLDTLNALHRMNITHKNINPDNIIIQPTTGRIKLIDFRIATQSTSLESFQRQRIEGTLSYISPEQTGRTNRSLDYRSDFYSLGVTFYEMLAKQLPFKTQDPLELIHCHLAIKPESVNKIVANIPEQIAIIIDKLLEKVPEERYASASGLKADLSECHRQWQLKNQIDLFPLGQQDTYEHLTFSQKLYGREEEIKQLLAAFDRVNHGSPEILLISGYSGIGKTTLIKEIYKPINYKRGYFATGKYDQLQRTTPYSAIIEAFEELVRHILSDSESRLTEIKEALLVALGNNGQVIVNVIPSLVSIIGPQPPIVPLSTVETQKRFMNTFQDFVRALAQPNRPLAIFLDDLQWIDSASLRLIEVLFANLDLKYFLLIGGYRDNEVGLDHPLLHTIQELRKAKVMVNILNLQPLKEIDIQCYLADSLNSPKAKLTSLVNLLLTKTQGNPFFINAFVKKLYEDKLLIFSYEQRAWEWNIEEIEKLNITDNVVELLIQRLIQLPIKTRKVLELAACVGHTFDFHTLIIISKQPLAETAKYLWEALQANLITAATENYHWLELLMTKTVTSIDENIILRFVHDRIQQAAYQLIPTEDTQSVHLEIARLLLKEKGLDKNDNRLFEILNHVNQSLSLITEKNECKQLSEYNLWAGEKAKTGNAYEAAKKYLYAGLELLIKSQQDITEYDLYFALNKELAVCHYLTGKFRRAEMIFKGLIENTKDILPKMDLYKLYCEMLATQNKHEEALQLGITALKVLNINIPFKPNMLQVLWSIIKVKFQIGGQKVYDLNLLPVTTDTHKACLKLMSQMHNSAFISNQNLFVLLVATDMRLNIKYGFAESSTFDTLVFAFTLMHALNQYNNGLDVVKLYEKLVHKFGEGVNRGKNLFILGSFIKPWTEPLYQSINTLKTAYQACCEVGDILYANYCFILSIFTIFMHGKPLDELNTEVKMALLFLNKNKISDFKQLALFWDDTLDYLTNNTFSIDKLLEHEKKMLAINNKSELGIFYSICTKLCYLFGEYEEVKAFSAKRTPYIEYLLGMVFTVEGYFYQALAIAATSSPKTRQSDLKAIKRIRSKIKRWASWCPANYQHYLYIIDAEIARINNHALQAGQAYKEAILAASNQHFTSIIAVANERAAHFWSSLNFPDVASTFLQRAHYNYQMWGLTSKCKLLEQKYPSWLSSLFTTNLESEASTAAETSDIDILSILKANQAISSEIQLDKLLQKLIQVLLQNAGADRAVLLSRINDAWFVEADGNSKNQGISLSQTKRVEDCDDIPLTLISYAHRTNEIVLFQSSADLDKFTKSDTYLEQVKPKSILILPILSQQKLRNLLYLENKLTSHAFTKKHIKTLEMLASQATISIENARFASESEMRKRLIFDTTMSAIIIIDAKGKITELNHSAEILFDYAPQELIGNDIAEIILPPEKHYTFHNSLANYIESQSDAFIGRRMEIITKHKNGNDLFLETTIIPSRSLSGILSFICFFINVTERIQNEAKIGKLNRDLLKIARQAGMAEVATGVLHNVGNILTSINTSAQMMHEKITGLRINDPMEIAELMQAHMNELGPFFTDNPKGKQIINYLTKLSKSWEFTQNNLLDETLLLNKNIEHVRNTIITQQTMSKTGGVIESVLLSDMLNDILAINNDSFIKHKVNMVKRYTVSSSPILIDRLRIEQIVSILIRNAIDSLKKTDISNRLLILAAQTDEHESTLIINVIDNGEGIKKENMDKIFNFGFTTKKEGHGFGLHSCFLAAKEMGGKISVTSDGEFKGATFTLTLPIKSFSLGP